MMTRIPLLPSLVLLAPLAACGGEDPVRGLAADPLDLGALAPMDEGGPPMAARPGARHKDRSSRAHDDYPAPHPAPPQVVSFGGPVMTSPRVVPVFFANDDPATVAAVEDFERRIGS